MAFKCLYFTKKEEDFDNEVIEEGKKQVDKLNQKYKVDESLIDSIVDIQNDVYDYVFFISRQEWYEIQNGYRTTEQVLSEKGLTEDVSDFITEFEKESNENRTILMKRMTSNDNNIRIKI